MRYLVSADKVILMITMIIGFIFVRKEDRTWLRLFPYFLLITLVVEITGWVLGVHFKIHNALLYSIFAIINFTFFTYFFRETTVKREQKKWITPLIYIVVSCFLVNLLFIQGLTVFNTYSFTAGCILMVILGGNYFYQIFESTTHYNLIREPSFWITIGIVFYFGASVTVTGLVNYISTLPAHTRSLLQKILFTVNGLYYILFIIAFICRKIPQRSSYRSL